MSKELSLYDLSEELIALDELLAMDAGELSPEYQELEKTVIGLISLKTDACVGFVNKLEDEIEAANRRIKQLKAYKEARERALERFEGYVKGCMTILAKDSFEGEFCQIKKRKPIKIVEIKELDKLAIEFIKVEQIITPDKKKIKDAIESGEFIDGAHLVDGKESISFGYKPVKTSKKK